MSLKHHTGKILSYDWSKKVFQLLPMRINFFKFKSELLFQSRTQKTFLIDNHYKRAQ